MNVSPPSVTPSGNQSCVVSGLTSENRTVPAAGVTHTGVGVAVAVFPEVGVTVGVGVLVGVGV